MPRPKWTREQAIAMGKRARELAAARKLAQANAPQTAVPQCEPVAVQSDNGSAEFQKKRLVRVRKQLDLIDAEIEREVKSAEVDAKRLEQLAAAASRLEEQERRLSNRSLPPTLRGDTVKPGSKAASLLGPVAGTVDDGPSQPQE